MYKNLSEVLKDFDEKFPLVECSAHERTSSSSCICDDLADINEKDISIKSFIRKALQELLEQVGVEKRTDDVNEDLVTINQPETYLTLGWNTARIEIEKQKKQLFS